MRLNTSVNRSLALAIPMLLAACKPAPSGDWHLDGTSDGGGDGDGDGDDEGGDGDGDDESEQQPEGADTEDDPACNDVDDVVLYLSPDDSNSMSAPVQVRDVVLSGQSWKWSLANRVWEFMNYYSFDLPPAPDGGLALTAALREREKSGTTTYELLLAVSSERMTDEERPPMNVTLVLDTSDSMAGEPIELLRDSCRAIAASLRAGDKVSIVEWSDSDQWTLVAHEVSGPNDPVLLAEIEATEPNGATDLNGGLISGYNLAQQAWDPQAINRLVLISDGVANAGVTGVELIAQNAVYGGSDGIYLVGAGVVRSGDGIYNDHLMDAVTDAGKGGSVFISDEAEAWKVFHENFVNTMAIAARNVQIELNLPPGFEIVKFSGEEFSSDPNEIEPQHLAPNDSMVLYQQLRTCAPELLDDDSEITVIARWEEVGTFAAREVSRTFTVGELLATENAALAKGAAVVAYTDALIQIAKDSNGVGVALSAADQALAVAEAALPSDPELAEIRQILEAL